MLKIILKFIPLLFLMGCSSKPITWKERVVHNQSSSVSLAFSEYGDKKNKTLLFLHGFGENRKTWRFLIPSLSKNYHLLMVDLKGFGDSPASEDEAYSVYDQAHFVQAFMREKNLKDVTLVGRSFGGGVALVLALIQEDKLMKSRIKNLILINSMAYKQRLPSMLRMLNKPIIGFLGIHFMSNDWMAEEGYRLAFYDDSLISKESLKYTSEYLAHPLAKYAYLQTVDQLIPDDIITVQKRYKEISLPTLILWGKEDLSIRVSTAYKLKKDLRNSRLKVFPFVGHMAQEEIPKKVSREIHKFMEENG
jgi:pimeloyl-ACP methyl ester carboxylesterase